MFRCIFQESQKKTYLETTQPFFIANYRSYSFFHYKNEMKADNNILILLNCQANKLSHISIHQCFRENFHSHSELESGICYHEYDTHLSYYYTLQDK